MNLYFGLMSPNVRFLVPTVVSLWMVSTCVVPTVKHGGVMVWGCFAGDTVGDLFKIQDIRN